MIFVECYWAGVSEELLRDATERTREIAAARSAHGDPVELHAAWLVPRDEVVFLIFSGRDDEVREVVEEASLPFERFAEAVDLAQPA